MKDGLTVPPPAVQGQLRPHKIPALQQPVKQVPLTPSSRTYMTFRGNWEQAMTTTIEAIKISASIISETRFFILHSPFVLFMYPVYHTVNKNSVFFMQHKKDSPETAKESERRR